MERREELVIISYIQKQIVGMAARKSVLKNHMSKVEHAGILDDSIRIFKHARIFARVSHNRYSNVEITVVKGPYCDLARSDSLEELRNIGYVPAVIWRPLRSVI